MRARTALSLVLLTAAAHAGPRTSSNYSILSDTADAGGRRAASAAYTNDASVGPVSGMSTVGAPAETMKDGYIGQLYNVTGMAVTGPNNPATVNGGATVQLAAAELLDDSSYLSVPAASVGWSVIAGPISGISSSGLATAAPVYQTIVATVQGTYAGFTGSLAISVYDLNNDSFGIYANDSIPDSWQVQYFGVNNPLACPNVDADGTGQTNLFKYIAELNPIDPKSRFVVQIQAVPGQSGQKTIVFSPRFTDRTYVLTSSTTLVNPTWVAVGNVVTSDSNTTRTVTDLSAGPGPKFYRVQITKN